MFTGIIEEVGSVSRLDIADGHARLEVACREVLADVRLGDSIAVAGCCLTVTELPATGGFAADLMAATVSLTSLAGMTVGDPVNLERAMLASTRFGGHLVQGHVDAVGTIADRVEEPGTVYVTVQLPAALANHVVAKGSVTLDGTSLTVFEVADGADGPLVTVALIPHTLAVTTWGSRKVGDLVNVEVDVLAKYVERMLAGGVQSPYQPPMSKDS